jgi:hypothetical protein
VPLDPSISALLLDFRFDMILRLLEGMFGFVAFNSDKFRASVSIVYRLQESVMNLPFLAYVASNAIS